MQIDRWKSVFELDDLLVRLLKDPVYDCLGPTLRSKKWESMRDLRLSLLEVR